MNITARRAVLGVLALLAPFGLVAGQSTTASALDPTKGYPGVCTGADATTGTTIVVDFQELDGNAGIAAPTITRCSPNANPGTNRTGVKALQDAGFALTGAGQWGLGFICRIENRPGPAEVLPPNQVVGCNTTPPASAYWSYWHANGTGSTWTYSSYGAANRYVVPGGFEGWSFSLNKSASTNPVPGVTPLNPASNPSATRVTLNVNDIDRTITLGQSTTLTWSTTNATSTLATGVTPAGGGTWTGPKGTSGTGTITPTAVGSYTYSIQATGAAGTTTTSASLTVVP